MQLPALQRLSRRWSLEYSLDQHGISFATMLDRVQDKGPLILAIMDTNGQVFGAYVSEPFKPCIGAYGSGECFLWRVRTGQATPTVEVFHWTGKNDYTIVTEHNFLAIGVDNGKFGLWLDGEFERGVSAACSTFDNPPLATDSEAFECARLEVWSIQ
ncbi:TLDc domain-containing protein [Thamnocephalis sphaerospora]|uniref:Oxidation resistance protein 1 n=1 Tax=Thamnocephalis sphaerospora TaxID=78915 RepID=A0A4P9XI15_9FUNG|nr:TLDc domain-containing protein [Thamnocephalis sphaerospora]|eukprot:RKP05277.1 TLDc domain-containing protein [Thamnocephalis sphaerospora]